MNEMHKKIEGGRLGSCWCFKVNAAHRGGETMVKSRGGEITVDDLSTMVMMYLYLSPSMAKYHQKQYSQLELLFIIH
jgi:hypothetical protein